MAWYWIVGGLVAILTILFIALCWLLGRALDADSRWLHERGRRP